MLFAFIGHIFLNYRQIETIKRNPQEPSDNAVFEDFFGDKIPDNLIKRLFFNIHFCMLFREVRNIRFTT